MRILVCEVEVACDARQVVGFVGAVPGEVTLLFVHPDHVGRGLGRRLWKCGLARAARGWTAPLTVVATRNAVGFYARYGFEPVEELAIERENLRIQVTRMQRPAVPTHHAPLAP